jgi:hypothetical protein
MLSGWNGTDRKSCKGMWNFAQVGDDDSAKRNSALRRALLWIRTLFFEN